MRREEERGHHRHIHAMRHTHTPALNTAQHTENPWTLLQAASPADQTRKA